MTIGEMTVNELIATCKESECNNCIFAAESCPINYIVNMKLDEHSIDNVSILDKEIDDLK